MKLTLTDPTTSGTFIVWIGKECLSFDVTGKETKAELKSMIQHELQQLLEKADRHIAYVRTFRERTTGILNPYARSNSRWLECWRAYASCQRIGVVFPARLWKEYEREESARRAREHD